MNQLPISSPRTIAIVTSSRADYCHLYWPLKELESTENVTVQLLVTGAHLCPEFGHTIDEIIADGFAITDRIECLVSSDRDVAMARTIGLATLGFAQTLDRLRPDLLLLIADRYEMMAPALAAMTMRIPIAHIEGGERSEGAIDNAVRNALSMMSHLHLTTTKAAASRLIDMGEEPWRVHQVGAASLDHLQRTSLPGREELTEILKLDLTRAPIIVAHHPVTLDQDPAREAQALFEALEQIDGPKVFCFPNADAGNRVIRNYAEEYCDRNNDARLVVNMKPKIYWGLLKQASAIVGNSSSGIMEAASIPIPAVNIGRRQEGRECPPNVINTIAQADAIGEAIENALSPVFRESIQSISNPYGDGDAARRITKILSEVLIDHRLLNKTAVH